MPCQTLRWINRPRQLPGGVLAFVSVVLSCAHPRALHQFAVKPSEWFLLGCAVSSTPSKRDGVAATFSSAEWVNCEGAVTQSAYFLSFAHGFGRLPCCGFKRMCAAMKRSECFSRTTPWSPHRGPDRRCRLVKWHLSGHFSLTMANIAIVGIMVPTT